MAEVQRVLAEIGAAEIPQVLVFNKLDRLEPSQRPRALRDVVELEGGIRTPRVFVSALDGTGLAELRAVLTELVTGAAGSTEEAGLNAAAAASPSEAAHADAEHAESLRTGTFDSIPAP